MINTSVERRLGEERRNYSLKTLKACAAAPRRMYGRRKEDRRYAILDRFESGVVALAIALMILSVMDSVFTLTLLSRGGTEENPIMDALLQHSLWAFMIFKMLMTGLPAVVLAATGNFVLFGRVRSRSLLATFVGLYLGLIVYEIGLLWISSGA